MKYRDPKTGKVFENILVARKVFCDNSACKECLLSGRYYFGGYGTCAKYVSRNPAEAAQLMGYEVFDNSSISVDEIPADTPTTLDDTPTVSGDTPTEKLVKSKPRLAEVLGVEVGERFTNEGLTGKYRRYFWIDEYGEPRPSDSFDEHTDSMFWILRSINHPESIIRAPRLTEPEIAIMRAVGAKFAFLNPGECFVTLSVSKPKWDDKYGQWLFTSIRTHDPVCKVRNTLFPSVHTGDCLPSPYTS